MVSVVGSISTAGNFLLKRFKTLDVNLDLKCKFDLTLKNSTQLSTTAKSPGYYSDSYSFLQGFVNQVRNNYVNVEPTGRQTDNKSIAEVKANGTAHDYFDLVKRYWENKICDGEEIDLNFFSSGHRQTPTERCYFKCLLLSSFFPNVIRIKRQLMIIFFVHFPPYSLSACLPSEIQARSILTQCSCAVFRHISDESEIRLRRLSCQKFLHEDMPIHSRISLINSGWENNNSKSSSIPSQIFP